MPIVSEIQELDVAGGSGNNQDREMQIDEGQQVNTTTENVHTSIPSLDSDFQKASVSQPVHVHQNLNFLRQKTHQVKKQLKEITEISQVSQDNETVVGQSMPL